MGHCTPGIQLMTTFPHNIALSSRITRILKPMKDNEH